MRRSSFNTSASSGVPNNGIFRAVVVSIGGDDLLRVRIPTLGLNNIYEGIPYAGPVPAAGDVVFVSSLEGKSGSFVAFTGVAYEGNTGAPTGDITSVVAGTNLNGGGTAGEVTLNLDEDITANLFGPVHINVKNTSGGTLAKGSAVYATGSVGASGAVEVQASDADNASTMPALGLLDDELGNNAVGSATVLGVIRQVDTSSYSINDELYVSSTPGVLTTTRPTGSSELVQKIGRVVRVHATTGEILVLGAGRTNDVPNEISISGDLTVGGSFNIVPAGTVVMHGAGTAPSGWLACDGSAVSRTTYADLFASIGTRYGSGDGSTTFNLPGTASLVPVGIAVSGSAGGTTVSGSSSLNALALDNQNADHSHTITVANANANHSHTITVANANANHSHSWSANFNTTNQNASHTHGYQKTNNSNVAANTNNQSASHSHNFNSGTVNTNAANAGHSHNANSANANANHSHNANAGNQSASHNHDLSSSTISTTINVEPFLFIIKT